jgi:hypothetical protein
MALRTDTDLLEEVDHSPPDNSTAKAARLGSPEDSEAAAAAAAAAAGIDIEGSNTASTKVYKPASPQSYCTCGFRHDEFLAGDFDQYAERPDAVCQASAVPGPSSCVKGPCGANPNVKQRKYSASSADAVYRLPKVVINMGGGGGSEKHAAVVFRGCFETSTVWTTE